MKLLARAAAIAVASILALIGRWIYLNAGEFTSLLGVGVHTLGMLAIFGIIFHWSRTSVRAPNFIRHRTRSAWAHIVMGVATLLCFGVVLSVELHHIEETALSIAMST